MAESVETADKQNMINVFNNSGLFSNHYLENMIQMAPEWEDEANLRAVYQGIRDIYLRKAGNLEKYVEADLEHNWIRPVLDRLDHHYGVQESVHQDPLKPDYAFFPDKKTLDEAYSYKHRKDSEGFYKKAVVVGDAKAWNVALDKSRQGKALREKANPSLQIDNYLRATPPKWAILTNGRLWRLYHEDTSFKLDCFYEVNLPEIIDRVERTGDLAAFKYFYLFFRREAFPETPLGPSFLDRIRQESLSYAQKIGSDLQENVYRAMKVLAEGFFAEQSNALSHSEEDIREVQENCMRLLYRLLFIFYAESRRLLDTGNRSYREMSLCGLKEDVVEKLEQGQPILAVRFTYWEGLRDLFRLINDGSEAFGYPKEDFYIPAYNGGLFDPEKNAFLASKKIGNSYLAAAIDLLARSEGERGKAYVDYSSLDIRHLGSIYEGILEYRLHRAEESMVAVKEKGREVWLAERDAGARKAADRIDAGRLYLVTDKGERKATGSFYTPEYIVKYIVKNTLGPLINPMMEEAMMSEDLRRGLFKKLLSIKVLDPAMGSGHFLVEATDYIAREIIHAREIARQEELESEAVAEADIHWARREVVRNCIYGVDLNPMAVELAKLSLWLTTVAANKPLSFLDHHLRCGNSLIGADLDRLAVLPGRPPEETPLWSFGLKSHTEGLLKKYSLMAALPDDNLAMVKWKEDQFRQIKEGELSRRLGSLADVWLSTYFGNKVSDDDYYEMQNRINPEKFPDWSGLRSQEWFLRAAELARGKRFFHWELEFPEAFQGESGGFDVVIGNPPYVRQERLGEDKRYFEMAFKTYHGVADLYVYFFERSHELLKDGGNFGFISSNKFMRSNYGKPLRNYLRNLVFLKQIIDFGELPVFPEAATFPAIYLTEKKNPSEASKSNTLYAKIPSLDFRSLDTMTTTCGIRLSSNSFERENWALTEDHNTVIMQKMDLSSDHLVDYTSDGIKRGIVTGFNEAFIIDTFTRERLISEDPKSKEIIKQFIFGDDVRKYEINFKNKYIIFARRGIDILNYPAVLRYLEQFKDKLQPRKSKDAHLGRKPGNYKWYELQDTIDYYSDFEKTKIVYPDIGMSCRFALDENGFYPDTTSFEIPVRDLYLLAILNSKLIFYYISSLAPVLGDSNKGGRLRFKRVYLKNIPVRRISFTTPAEERARLGAELQDLYAAGKHAEILAAVQDCLPQDEAGNFVAERERSDVVHDLLAFLAERMLEINKAKQKEIRGFLGWLEGYLGAKVEDLTPKTKLQGYYEHDYESFLAVLKKNKKKLAVDPGRREPGETLRAEFEGSMAKLLPLRERIRQTDELIDAAVYRLYGLTEEEIGIVEGEK